MIRKFDSGVAVLGLSSGARGHLGWGFAGPYRVFLSTGEVNYVISTPHRRSKMWLCYGNVLKGYEGPVLMVG